MNNIGILAYGSLIEDPGIELKPLISDRKEGIETPFNIEFARSSRSRDGAPTVIPVEGFGAPVKAIIFALNSDIELFYAKDLLWRRETRNESSDKHYTNPNNPKPNQVVVGVIKNSHGFKNILFTKIGANIKSPTPRKLAKLAIDSAKSNAGRNGKDGISYLMSLKRQNISTPLMEKYEKEILKITNTSSLKEALSNVRKCL